MNPQIFITANTFVSICAFLVYTYLLLNYNNECADKNMFTKLRALVLLSIIIMFISILSHKLSDKTIYFLLVIPLFGIANFLLFMDILLNFKNCEIYNSERVIFSTIATIAILLCSIAMIFYFFYTRKVLNYNPREDYRKVLNSHKNFISGGPGFNAKKLTANIVNEPASESQDVDLSEITGESQDVDLSEITGGSLTITTATNKPAPSLDDKSGVDVFLDALETQSEETDDGDKTDVKSYSGNDEDFFGGLGF